MQRRRPAGCHRRRRQHGHPGQPIVGQQPAKVARTRVHVGRRQPVGLVERKHHHFPVRGQRPQIRVVQHCVGVLLWVEDPDEGVDEAHQPVHLGPVGQLGGVVVGQVEQHQAAQLGGGRRVAVLSCPDLQPVQQFRCTGGPEHDSLGHRRRRPPHADRSQRGPGDGVEQRRFPAACRSGQRHHGVLAGQPQPSAGPLVQAAQVGEQLVGQPTVAERGDRRQRRQPIGEHHRRTAATRSAAARSWSPETIDDAAPSTSR